MGCTELPAAASEQSGACRESLAQELEGYHSVQTLITVNRDGDWFYVECPRCHGTDLHRDWYVACRNCHTFFDLNPEDGLKTIQVANQYGHVSAYEDIKLVKLDPNDDQYKIIYGRNKDRLQELKEKYPNLEIRIMERDLRNGKDAHGHSQYHRYAVIPLD